MPMIDNFEFLNSDIWIKYTQERYFPLEDIKHRPETLGHSKTDWPNLKKKIQSYRKLNSIPLFIKTIDKKFLVFSSRLYSAKN